MRNIIEDEKPHLPPMFSNWIDGTIPYHDESVIIEPKEETKEAVISLATVCDKYEITEEVTNISEEEYRLKYKETHYFKYFNKTPRYPNFKEAIEDFFTLFPYSDLEIMDIFYENKNNPARTLIKIWTSNQKITKLINLALIIDAGKHFNFDKKEMAFLEDYIVKNGNHEEQIIKYSIKFMRLLNAYIVDRGWEYNTEDRVAYRGVSCSVLKEAQVGQTYRLVTWNCTSDSFKVAEFYSGLKEGKEGSMVKFNIPKYCCNAGKLNCIEISSFEDEDETLIPPYSVCTVVERNDNYFELNLAFDNQDADLSQKALY